MTFCASSFTSACADSVLPFIVVQCKLDLKKIETMKELENKLNKMRKLFTVYEQREKKLLKALGDAQYSFSLEKENVVKLGSYADEYNDAHNNYINKKNTSVQQLMNDSAFSSHLHDVIKKQKDILEKKEKDLSLKKELWQKAYIEKNKIKQLIEKQEYGLSQALEKREEKKLDELVTLMNRSDEGRQG
jgi:flagellar export protein FliJ